ncbi:MAG: hypothetical protein P8011_09565 [Acidihalobacter sp.]|uniref:hypothetical protein n=1 Tax=Acidihalobacter sp. TaxID=1872108 RepID=UPI00307F90F7
MYTVAAQGAHQDCTIEFRPQHRRILAALPKPVQRFEHLLEKSIGPGEEEGTLHPTLTLLLHVRRLLANMAFRPWAVSDADAYNTRERVDLGLVVWAEQGASYSRLYLQIQHAYAPAEHALAAFYERKYDMSPERAKRFAAKVTDILYRANFVFSTRD